MSGRLIPNKESIVTQRITRRSAIALLFALIFICGPWLCDSPRATAAPKKDITVRPEDHGQGQRL
jgi:hypothetical protein